MRGLVACRLAELPAPATCAGRLDLDHVRTVTREVHAAIGSGDTLREIQNLYALEGKIIHRHPYAPSCMSFMFILTGENCRTHSMCEYPRSTIRCRIRDADATSEIDDVSAIRI